MAQRGPSSPRGRRFYIKGIGAVGEASSGSFVFKTAPQRRSLTQSKAQQYTTATMGVAAWFTKLLTAWEYQTAKDLAGRSGYTWKDMVIAMFYGTAIEFTDANGVLWTGRRILTNALQTMLDTISTTPGSVIVRTPTGWAALYPGSPDYQLTIDPATNLPNWLPPTPGPSGKSANGAGPGQFSPKTSGAFNAGYWGGRFVKVSAGQNLTKFKFWATTASSTPTVQPAFYDHLVGAPNNLIYSVPAVTGVIAGENEIDINYTAPADAWIWIGMMVQVAVIQMASCISNQAAAFYSHAAPPQNPAPTCTYAGEAWGNSFWAE